MSTETVIKNSEGWKINPEGWGGLTIEDWGGLTIEGFGGI